MRILLSLALGLGLFASVACSAGERAEDAPLTLADAPAPGATDAGAEPSELDPLVPQDTALDDASADAAPELWVTSSPTCTTTGAVGAVFRGVPVYCQVSGPTGYYQCDELANRFLRDALAHPNIDNVVSDYASSMCARAAAMPAYQVFGGTFAPAAGSSPVAGDLVVWPGTPGHVAVVTSVAGGEVRYLQENATRVVDKLAWSSGAPWPTECWIHPVPVAAPPPPAASAPSCGCFDGDGDYCGLSIVNHAAWYGCKATVGGGGADYDHLYACAEGVFTAKRSCKHCVTALLTDARGVCSDP